MVRIKLYESRAWLYRKYVIEKLTEEEIAKLAKSSQPTIHRWLEKFELIKRR